MITVISEVLLNYSPTKRKKFRVHANFMVTRLASFLPKNPQVRIGMTIGGVSGAVTALILMFAKPHKPEDDIIARLDAETRRNTSAEQWRSSGMIPK